ncbi:phenylacetate--CoA ligase family protein, partial [Chloroflexota bacterium]
MDVKIMYAEILRKAYFLYLNARYGNKNWHRYYQEMRESQWWPPDKIAELQLERLKALLRHAYQNVPYYNRRFTEARLHPDDIKTLDDLAKLPILTKKDIRENQSELVARRFPQRQVVPTATSGSTGEPLQFFRSREGNARGLAGAFLAYSWYGYQPGDKRIHLYGKRGVSGYDSMMQSLFKEIRLRIARIVHFDAYSMSEKQMERLARKIYQFKPKMITAYASVAYLLARYLKHRGIENIRTEAVVSHAQQLFPEYRELIREVFGCEVFDIYGSVETPSMATECPEHTGYHVLTPNVILEFIRNNQPVSPGKVGKIVATDLHNYAMPFIRYENGDLGIPLNEKCPCGRGLPLMKEITGRINDIIIGP